MNEYSTVDVPIPGGRFALHVGYLDQHPTLLADLPRHERRRILRQRYVAISPMDTTTSPPNLQVFASRPQLIAWAQQVERDDSDMLTVVHEWLIAEGWLR